jgi:hypothetical protein
MIYLAIAGVIVAAAGAIGLFLLSAAHKRRAEKLEKVPVSPVGNIEDEGETKVVGKVVALDKAIQSPLSRAKCVYYRFAVEENRGQDERASRSSRRRSSRDDDGDWRTIVDDVRTVAFAIEDDTGMAAIEPKRLDVEIKSKRRIDSGRLKELTGSQQKLLTDRYPDAKLSFTKNMRYTEVAIEVGDELAVTGDIVLPKDDHPRFRVGKVFVSDVTRNRKAEDCRGNAQTSLIFSGVSGAFALGCLVWLIVMLASPKKPSSSSTETEIARNPAPSENIPPVKDDRQPFKDNNPPFKVENPPFKVENPPFKDNNPFERPKDKNLPQAKDFDSVLARYKAQVEMNEFFGSKAALKELGELYKPDHPKRTDVLNLLLTVALNGHPHLRGDALTEACRWSSKDDVPKMCEILVSCKDGGMESIVFNKLKEYKDPRSTVAVASFITNFFKRQEAADVLRAIGPPAQKAVLPFAKVTGPDGQPANFDTRRFAVEILGDIGTKDSVPLLRLLSDDPQPFVREAAVAALKKVKARK